MSDTRWLEIEDDLETYRARMAAAPRLAFLLPGEIATFRVVMDGD